MRQLNFLTTLTRTVDTKDFETLFKSVTLCLTSVAVSKLQTFVKTEFEDSLEAGEPRKSDLLPNWETSPKD